MVPFCGQDRCLVDSNGRIKLSARFLSDFLGSGPEVVVHCLPEGALGVYPVSVWMQMRRTNPRPAETAGQSVVFRRELRRMGALTRQEAISNQGRITIPPEFRKLTNLEGGTECLLVGCEIGMEIWNTTQWEAEFQRIQASETQRAEAEMANYLKGLDTP